MNKHPFGLVSPLLLSGIFFLTIVAARPPQTIRPTQPSWSVEQVSMASKPEIVFPPLETTHTITTTATESSDDPLPGQTGWADTCVNWRMEISGVGMGDENTSINPQTLLLTDPASVNWLLAQVAGRSPTPESMTFTTSSSESITLPEPNSTSPGGYTFETTLQPISRISAFVSELGDKKTPRGLILYAKRDTGDERWASVGKTFNEFVYWQSSGNESHIEPLTFQPLTQTTDLIITAVVIDNNADERPLKLEATAGNVTEGVTENGPTEGPRLNIIRLTLPQVPTGTDRVNVTLESPHDNNGDSLVWVGVNVSYRCINGNNTPG